MCLLPNYHHIYKFCCFVVQTRLLVTTHSIQCYMHTFYRPNTCCWQTAKNERNMNKWTMDIICTMESFGFYEAEVNILKLRERERHRVDQGKKRKKMDGGWWISFPWCFTLNLVNPASHHHQTSLNLQD